MIFSAGGDTQLAWIFEHGFKLLSGFLHWLSFALLISVSTPFLGIINYLNCLLFFYFLRQPYPGFPTRRLPEPDMYYFGFLVKLTISNFQYNMEILGGALNLVYTAKIRLLSLHMSINFAPAPH